MHVSSRLEIAEGNLKRWKEKYDVSRQDCVFTNCMFAYLELIHSQLMENLSLSVLSCTTGLYYMVKVEF